MLTKQQAIAYCRRKGAPGADQSQRHQESEWHRLAVDLEQDGLELTITTVNDDLAKARTNTDFRKSYDTTVYQAFLDALYDDGMKEEFAASELIEAMKKDDPGGPLEQAIQAAVLEILEQTSEGEQRLYDAVNALDDLKETVGGIIDDYIERVTLKQDEAED